MATSARLDELKKKFDENPRRYFAPLANEYRKQGDLPQAIALCRAHLPNQPGHISGHVVLGQSLFEAHALGESREAFEAALDLDPENLIALRHLGDIARETGAPDEARSWYQRVLEADPRNDEIAQLLRVVEASTPAFATGAVAGPDDSSLDDAPLDDAAAQSAPPPPAWIPASPIATVHDVTPEPVEIIDGLAPLEAHDGEPILEMIPAAEPITIDEAASPRPEDLSEEMPSPEILSDLEAAAEYIPDDWFAPQPAARSSNFPSERAVLAEDEDSLFPSLSAPTPTASPAVASEEGEALAVSAEASADESQVPTPPYVAAHVERLATDPTPPVLAAIEPSEVFSDFAAAPEPLVDLEQSGADATEQEVPAGFIVEYSEFVPPEADETPFIASTIAVPIDDADAYSAGVPELSAHELFAAESSLDAPSSTLPRAPEVREERVSEPMDVPLPIEAFEEELVVLAEADEGVVAPTDESVFAMADGIAAPEAEAPHFVTETMAELYLQQGFIDQALAIYHQLLDQEPEDVALRERVSAIERKVACTVVAGGGAMLEGVDRHGQSARSFFAHFARRAPRLSAVPSMSGGLLDANHGDTGTGAMVAREYAGAATRDEALTVPDALATGPSLTQLFASGDISGADEDAAAALASAFDETVGDPLTSRRPGERELSLEHLFRDVQARSSGAVTLDEFYQGSSPAERDPASRETEEGEDHDADIEQFTAWLEGLKKK